MAGKETGGLVEGYKNFNKLTRNAELAGAGILAVLGSFGFAGVLALGAAIDQAQIKAIEWWQNRKKKAVEMKQDVEYDLPKTAI